MRLLAVHVVPVLALGALAVWFGVLDTSAFGEGRCPSCGVEGYVVAAHAAVAVLLAAAIALGVRLRGRRGRGTLILAVLAGIGAGAAIAWDAVFSVYALVALLGSLAVAPLVLVWWAVSSPAILRRAPATHELDGALTRAWLALLVLLPGLFAAVWLDRVEWFVF